MTFQPSVFESSSFFQLYSPGYTKRIIGEGMPVSGDASQFGDLLVQFKVTFPATLTPQQKALITQSLSQD